MTLISRVLGLLRDIVIANYFSLSQSDVFFMALRIPNTMRRFFAEGAFANAFVPVLNDYKTNYPEKENAFINVMFSALASVLLLVTLLGVLFSGVVVTFIGFGFEAAESALGTTMLKITFPYILFVSLTAFFAGILNTYKKFALPAFVPALLNISLIVFALYGRDFFDPPVLALAWGVFFGGLLQFLIQIPTLWRLKKMPKPQAFWRSQAVKRVVYLMLPTLFGSSVGQISIFLNTALASSLVAGSITWLYYADRLVELPIALIGVALGVVILPQLSALKAAADERAFAHTLAWALRIAFVVGSAATTGLCTLSLPLLTTMLVRGQFSAESALMSAKSLVIFAFGGLFWVMTKVLAPAFYARQDSKTPAKVAVIALFVNMCVALSLYRVIGHLGLALASTMAAVVNVIGLSWGLYQRQLLVFSVQGIVFVLRVLIANALLAIVLLCLEVYWVPMGWVMLSEGMRLFYLLLLIGVGLLTYLGLLPLLGVSLKRLINPRI